jgi:hypothetical protein
VKHLKESDLVVTQPVIFFGSDFQKYFILNIKNNKYFHGLGLISFVVAVTRHALFILVGCDVLVFVFAVLTDPCFCCSEVERRTL